MTEHIPFVGRPIQRVEDVRLLRGKGCYVGDVERSGQLHGAILRSSTAHGILRGLDTSAARALPGVHAVITAADLGNVVPRIPVRLFPNQAMKPFHQPVMASEKVRFVGEPIALVVADTRAIAEDALELISVDIDPLPAVSTMRGDECPEPLFDACETNRAFDYRVRRGDVAAAFAIADYTRRERLYVHRHTGITMETRGVVSEWDPAAERMTSWGALKVPFANRKILAAMMGLPEESVDMIEGDSGGSFGVRGEFFPEDFLVPFAAKMLGRPVKWIEDRREHLLAVSHARDITCDLAIACSKDGHVLALQAELYVDVGAYFRTSTTITPRNVGQFIPGPYRVPHYSADVAVMVSNKSPSGTYRGPGRFEADFFRERMFDLAAKDLGIDRVEFRRRNLLTEAELPYAIPAIEPDPVVTELDSGAYEHVLNLCLDKIGWREKQALQGKFIDGRYHGLAVACFVEGGAAGPRENAKMALEDDGSVSVYVGSSAVGQGVQTILLQIAADALELPMERLRLFHGSTTYVKEGWGSYHSRSTVMGGNAILIAAKMLIGQIKTAAAGVLQCSPDEVTYKSGVVTSERGGSVQLKELGGGITYEATFSNHKHTYTYGSHAVHLTVDPGTGRIDILDYVGFEDAGRIINPLTLHGQALGSIVQGLGGTLLEQFIYDADGQMLCASLADYLVPLASDFPNIRTESLELRPSPNHPLGAKGAGEGGTIPVGGLVANAVAAALRELNIEPLSLPLTPDCVWRLIQDARERRPNR